MDPVGYGNVEVRSSESYMKLLITVIICLVDTILLFILFLELIIFITSNDNVKLQNAASLFNLKENN